MQIDNLFLNNIVMYSFILGAILGTLTPIPYVGWIFFLAMLIFSAPIVMTYLIMLGKYQLSDIKNSIISGTIIGFCVNFSFSITFAIITFLLGIILKYKGNLFIYSMITNSPVWLLITFIIFVGVLVASINAFSGFGTYYIINLIRDIYEKKYKINK